MHKFLDYVVSLLPKVCQKKIYEWTLNHRLRAINKDAYDELKREIEVSGLGDREFAQEDQEKIIAEGILLMKKAINSLVKDKTKSEYDSLLKKIDNLIKCAEYFELDEEKSLQELRKKIIVYSGKDIKTAEDKARMIDTRIGHFYKLQDRKEERALQKRERQARNSGDLELAEKLLQEWKEKYGKLR